MVQGTLLINYFGISGNILSAFVKINNDLDIFINAVKIVIYNVSYYNNNLIFSNLAIHLDGTLTYCFVFDTFYSYHEDTKDATRVFGPQYIFLAGTAKEAYGKDKN